MKKYLVISKPDAPNHRPYAIKYQTVDAENTADAIAKINGKNEGKWHATSAYEQKWHI